MHNLDAAILITAQIDESLSKTFIKAGMNADVIPFIQTKAIATNVLREKIKSILQEEVVVVFTSANAVEAVKENLQSNKPAWKIYCIENTTAKLVEKYFGNSLIAATAENATGLAEKIAVQKASVNAVYFFCGNKKRDELPGLLRRNNISVEEIEVYTTTILPHTIEKIYDAVLFFSPSAAEGFFLNNSMHEKTIAFAIGSTTEQAIKKFTNNTVIVNDKPGKRELIEKAINFFKS